MSLRARLLLVTLALVAVALTAAGWATHVALKSFLLDRVDRELVDLRAPALFAVGDSRPGPSGLPANAIVRVILPDGHLYFASIAPA